MWIYAELHHTLDIAGRYMSATQADRAATVGNPFLIAYQRLAEQALARGEALFYLRPKFHEAAHMMIWLQSTRYTLRFLACWADEDFIGKVCVLAKVTNVCRPRFALLSRWRGGWS